MGTTSLFTAAFGKTTALGGGVGTGGTTSLLTAGFGQTFAFGEEGRIVAGGGLDDEEEGSVAGGGPADEEEGSAGSPVCKAGFQLAPQLSLSSLSSIATAAVFGCQRPGLSIVLKSKGLSTTRGTGSVLAGSAVLMGGDFGGWPVLYGTVIRIGGGGGLGKFIVNF